MGLAQLNVRIDAGLKSAGDSVLERCGVSTVQIIRSLWQYMSERQTVPDFAKSKSSKSKDDATAGEQGAGMAMRLAREAGLRAELEAMSFSELREAAFEEMLIEKAGRNA